MLITPLRPSPTARLEVATGMAEKKSISSVRSLTYGTWISMRARCYSPSNGSWKNYGGRGVSICARWRNDYQAFLSDMGERPDRAHTIDRINNDGDYEPGNCRWADKRTQRLNQRALPPRTHCRFGHPLDADNSRSRSYRGNAPVAACRQCKVDESRRYRRNAKLRFDRHDYVHRCERCGRFYGSNLPDAGACSACSDTSKPRALGRDTETPR